MSYDYSRLSTQDDLEDIAKPPDLALRNISVTRDGSDRSTASQGHRVCGYFWSRRSQSSVSRSRESRWESSCSRGRDPFVQTGSSRSPRVSDHATEQQEALEARLWECVRSKQEKLLELDEVKQVQAQWALKAQQLESDIQEKESREKRLQEELHELMHPNDESQSLAPGPACLLFVEGDCFNMVAAIIIVSNVASIVVEDVDKQYEARLFWLDQSFMVFYVFELTLKSILWQRDLVIGPCARVWWNWLDILIVVSGVIDMWILPTIMTMAGNAGRTSSGGFSVASFLRILRLARLARMLRIVRIVLYADLSWAEGERFQVFMMIVICVSSIMMGLEADLPNFFMWFYLENIVLSIFAFEIVVRLKLWGCRFFCPKDTSDLFWNYLDFSIVLGGVIDMWLMPAISFIKTVSGHPENKSNGGVGKLMMVLRMARLLRILRLARLIKSIPPLYSLLKGIAQAMAGMMWVLLLTIVLLYAFALLAVKLLRDGIVYGGDSPEAVSKVFDTVPETIYILFGVMNGNLDPLSPVFETLPLFKIVAMLFVVLSSWAILSILTAVVSENMINATESIKKEMEEQSEIDTNKRRRQKLDEVFDMADYDGNGLVTSDEFDEMLKDPLKRVMVCDATSMNVIELKEIFNLIENKGNMHREDFIKCLERIPKEVQERHVMQIEKKLNSIEEFLREKLGD